MHDLLVIIPSRGRPKNLAELASVYANTCTAGTQVFVALDDDDPELLAYHGALDGSGFMWTVGPRKTLTGWTNSIAARFATSYRAMASFGDDHYPHTRGWDTELLAALDDMGGTGFAYPCDLRRADVPEACVISSDIVTALGWMCCPQVAHFYNDNVWRDLGAAAGCLRYQPDIVVEHRHPCRDPGVPADDTYQEAARGLLDDENGYRRWRRTSYPADVATVRHLSEQARAGIPRQ